jgi:hypothetical protein
MVLGALWTANEFSVLFRDLDHKGPRASFNVICEDVVWHPSSSPMAGCEAANIRKGVSVVTLVVING